MEAREKERLEDVSIVRLEQLYPFPGEPLAARLKRMTNLKEVVWCQEEPKNNGAWFFVESRIEIALTDAGHKRHAPELCRPRRRRLARHRPRQPPQGASRRRWSPTALGLTQRRARRAKCGLNGIRMALK